MGQLNLCAAVDIGSHSCILLMAAFEQVNESDAADSNAPKLKLVPKIQKVEICRLGEDIFETGAVSKTKQEELIKILSKFRSTVHAFGIEIQEVVMTEAMRKASNRDEVLAVVEKALQKKPRIISGEEEAAYTYRAVMEWHGSSIATIDIGGGSTEFSNGRKKLSIPIGALFLFKKFGPIPGPEYKGFIKETFKESPIRDYAKLPVFLVGGTATALAMLFLNMSQFDYEKIEGLELTLADLETVITRVTDLSKELRATLPGLSGGRSEVIIDGLFWLRSILERLHAESFRISTAGVRFGVLYPEIQEVEKEKPKRVPPWLKKKADENIENGK